MAIASRTIPLQVQRWRLRCEIGLTTAFLLDLLARPSIKSQVDIKLRRIEQRCDMSTPIVFKYVVFIYNGAYCGLYGEETDQDL
jgi:hypothetical protein